MLLPLPTLFVQGRSVEKFLKCSLVLCAYLPFLGCATQNINSAQFRLLPLSSTYFHGTIVP